MKKISTVKQPEIKPFKSAIVWERWLSTHPNVKEGIWLQIAKKSTGIPTVTYDEALDVALCYGWIDGQRKSFDTNYFIQKFTPRRSKSLWSKRNVAKVSQLIKRKKMQPAGLVEVKAAKKDGRWQAAYDSQKDMVVPDDFLKAIEQNKKAKDFFNTLNKTSLYAIAWRLHTARTPEVRLRRFTVLFEKLKKGEKI